MIKFLKFILILTIIAIDLTVVEKWYTIIINGGYFQNASFLASVMVGVVAPVCVLYFSFHGIKAILKYK